MKRRRCAFLFAITWGICDLCILELHIVSPLISTGFLRGLQWPPQMKYQVMPTQSNSALTHTYKTMKEHKPLARSARLSVSSPSTFQEIRDSLSSSSSEGLRVEAGLLSVKSILEIFRTVNVFIVVIGESHTQ